MASTSVRFEDRLDGASNFLSWKVRVALLLEEKSLGYCQGRSYFAYRSATVDSSQQEGSEGQVDDLRCF
jgi:hypothetical protein